MDRIRRFLATQYTYSNFEKKLVEATFSDNYPENSNVYQEILQGLLGQDSNIFREQAVKIFYDALHQQLSYKSALKFLLLVQFIIESPQTTAMWLWSFTDHIQIFPLLKTYQDAASPAGFSHSRIIRNYATLLDHLLLELTDPSSILSKITHSHSIQDILKNREYEKLFEEAKTAIKSINLTLEIFFNDEIISLPSDFSEITLQVMNQSFQTCLHLYQICNLLFTELLDRLSSFEFEDIKIFHNLYKDFFLVSDKILRFCNTMKRIPHVDPLSIPKLLRPSQSILNLLETMLEISQEDLNNSTQSDTSVESDLVIHYG